MAFEFFFGVFGLISSDSKSRHKSRLESEWRLPTPSNASLFREAGIKSPLSSSPMFKSGQAAANAANGSSGAVGSGGGGGGADSKRPIFSTTGTLAAANSGAANEGLFNSNSSSSASSIASSGSNLTTNSTSAFIKPDAEQTKKYEFRLNLSGEKAPSNSFSSSSGNVAGNLRLSSETTDNLAANLGAKLASGAGELITDGQTSEAGSPTNEDQEPTTITNKASRSQRLRKCYCLFVCAGLWFHVLRLIIGLLFDKSMLTLDFYSLGTYKIHFLIPAMCLAIQAAAVATLFIRNNDETNWLVPFYSSKDYLIRSRSNFKPKIEDYTRRVNISVALALVLALISSISLSAYLVHCVGQSDIALAQQHHQANLNRQQSYATQYETLGTSTMAPPQSSALSMPPARVELLQQQQQPPQPAYITSNNRSGMLMAEPTAAAATFSAEEALELSANRMEQLVLAILLALDVMWAVYSTYICFLVSFYFNLICSIMKSRFHGISKIIEDLAESNTTKTTNQARKITTLYLEHNEACELLDESNDFWQYLIFFTYFTYIPAYCYCLYNLFFVDFEAWPSFITWVIHTHTGFIILLISFSAAGVSTEAHAPYTSLHTLSLIQLPLDVEVNIATFLHRVRGLTIGYSCYDLFAITNASMSNTAAACASYFLIVADFSRSSVFTLAQMNGSTAAAAAAAAAGGGGAAATTPTPS